MVTDAADLMYRTASTAGTATAATDATDDTSLRLAAWTRRATDRLDRVEAVICYGRVEQVRAMLVVARLPRCAVGDLCELRPPDPLAPPVLAEVIGFDADRAWLVPLGPTDGIESNAPICTLRVPHSVNVGPHLLGEVIDGFGRPMRTHAPACDPASTSCPRTLDATREWHKMHETDNTHKTQETHETHRHSMPVPLRRVDAIAKARHRLSQAHEAHCPLTGGGAADLSVREDVYPAHDGGHGLPLSTRFGPAIAYDYASLLLACTGINMTRPRKPPAQAALARYAFAALAPALQHALGEPAVSDTAAAALQDEPTFPIYLVVRLPSIRLTMRWVMTAAGVHALLDSDPWHPIAGHSAPPSWLTALHSAIPVDVGEAILPLAECDALSRGDVIRIEASAFDVMGRATVRVGPCALQLRWLDTHRCFEVENMTDAPSPSPQDALDATGSTNTAAPIDTGSIPVRLSFSLGALGATVGELAALRPGSLLELKRGMPPEVTIEANGCTIGSGELVDLDGRLAVEITRWPQPCAPSPAS